MRTEDILNTLYSGYYSMYLVDGKIGKYTVLHTTGLYEQYNKEINDFEGAIYDYACNYVNERDKNRVINSTKLSLVKEKLKTERDVVITYQMKNSNEWRSLNFIRTVNYENDETFLMGISVYNKEIQQYYNTNQLKDVISSITEEFQAIYRIDLKMDKIETLYSKILSDYYVDSSLPYSYIEKEYRNNYVDKAYLSEMNNSTSQDALRKHFSQSDEPKTYYYKENNGNWYKMIMSKDRDYTIEHPYVILAVKECADDIALETNTIVANLLMSKMFCFTAMIDLKNNTYEVYHSENDFYMNETTGKFDILLECCRDYIYEEDYEYYRSLFDSNLPEPNTFMEKTFRAEDQLGMMHFYNAIISKVLVPDGEKLLLIIRNEDERELNRTRYASLEKKHNTIQNMLYAMGDMYYSMYYYNSDNGKIEVLRAPDEITYLARNSDTYEMFFSEYAKQIVHPDYRERFIKCVSQDNINNELSKGKTNINCEFMRLFDDEYRWVNLNIHVTTIENGKIKEMVFAGKDIHDERNEEIKYKNELQKALYEAKAANEAKSSFLSNMSHDMRTPLNAILGMTDVALMHIDDKDRILNSIDVIKTSGKHLLQLINEVLDMSYIESKKIILKNEVVYLPELFHDIIRILQGRIKNQHLTFKADAINITHETVITDAVRIRQILTNLLINAIKYTPEYGNITMTIEQIPSIPPDVSEYKIIISDTGVGMSEEFLQKIYEPFERAMDTTQSGIEGIGLGMAITLKLINALNGHIEVESELGKGSSFIITLPLKRAFEEFNSNKTTDLSDYEIIYYEKETENFPDILRKASANGKVALIHSYDISEYISDIRSLGITKTYLEPVFKSDLIESYDSSKDICTENSKLPILTGKKILVADDNQINLSIVCDYLEDMDISYETAENGLEAYKLIISDNSFDLILMDVRMPVMDGYEATKKIRTYGQSYTTNIPIIAMTANAFEEDIATAKLVGMNEHISKPIDFEKFVTIINSFLG